jgi:hypothetical protein
MEGVSRFAVTLVLSTALLEWRPERGRFADLAQYTATDALGFDKATAEACIAALNYVAKRQKPWLVNFEAVERTLAGYIRQHEAAVSEIVMHAVAFVSQLGVDEGY